MDLRRSLLEALSVEEAALEIGAEQMGRLAAQFSVATEADRAGFDDDRTLLHRDVSRLAQQTRDRLEQRARGEASRYDATLDTVAANSSAGELADRLRDTIEKAVRGSFESLPTGGGPGRAGMAGDRRGVPWRHRGAGELGRRHGRRAVPGGAAPG